MQSHIWVIEVQLGGEWVPADCFAARKAARIARKRHYTYEYSRIRKFIAA